MELPESRTYTRDLSLKEINYLKGKYRNHVKKSRVGFLNTKQKEKLLHITKWREESRREIYDSFYEIREHAKSAIDDFRLLCDVLTESQLQEIFARTETHENKSEQIKLEQTIYPITLLLKSLLPYPILIGDKAKEVMKEIAEKQQWRKYILEDVMITGLIWYFNSGIFMTDLERKTLFDTIDAISVKSSGIKRFELIDNMIVKF